MSVTKMIPDQKKVLHVADCQLSQWVCDAVNLEGIDYTLSQVQAILRGKFSQKYSLSDQTITLNQAHAWQFLFSAIQSNEFSLSKAFVCQLHDIAAKEEALTWGGFRQGDVTIAGTDYRPPASNTLDAHWQSVVFDTAHLSVDQCYKKAIGLFLDMARLQFFYDVNKRMGRFMMNGILLSCGYPAINLPAKRQLQFNQLMLDFYQNQDKKPMTDFMLSCLDPHLVSLMSESA